MPNEQHPDSTPDDSAPNDAAEYSDEEGVEAEITNVARYPSPPPSAQSDNQTRSAARTGRKRADRMAGFGAGLKLMLVLVLLAAVALVFVLIRFMGDPYGIQGSLFNLQATLM